MANEEKEKTPEKVQEPTYVQQLMAQGWININYSQGAHAIDLKNPDPEYTSVGIIDGMGQKQHIVVLPNTIWLELLTNIAKKQAKK